VVNIDKSVAPFRGVLATTLVSEDTDLVEPHGRIGHAELAFGDASAYLSDEFPELNVGSPKPNEPATFITHLHVDDAGTELLRAPEDQFFGERSGTIRDPFGYEWLIGHSLEAVEPDEMQRRYSELLS
jgi:PhnB protein